MATKIVKSQRDLTELISLLKARKLPITVTIASGKHRSVYQNRLQRLWLNEAAEQLEDHTPEELRGYCKLAFGVPILRAENEKFREAYDRLIKGRPYEEKVAMMMEPIDLPVTRIMSAAQKTKYLDAIFKHFTEQGVALTIPLNDWR